MKPKGFVFDLFGKIPVKYEKTVYQGTELIVQEMDEHKIKSVKIVAGNREQRKKKIRLCLRHALLAIFHAEDAEHAKGRKNFFYRLSVVPSTYRRH